MTQIAIKYLLNVKHQVNIDIQMIDLLVVMNQLNYYYNITISY